MFDVLGWNLIREETTLSAQIGHSIGLFVTRDSNVGRNPHKYGSLVDYAGDGLDPRVFLDLALECVQSTCGVSDD